MARPPQSLAVEGLAPSLAPLFERAFGRGSAGENARPAAADWHAALAAVAADLATCGADRGHRHPARLPECPWCQLMADGAPNFFLSVTFRGATPAALDVGPELAALVRSIDRAPRLRTAPLPPPPKLINVVPTPPPPAVESAQSLATMVRYVAAGSLVAMLAMLVVPESGYASVPVFTVFALWWLLLFLTSGHRPERHRRRKVLRARRGQLKHLHASWHATISAADAQQRAYLKELRAARDQIEKLRARHDADLRKLSRDVWQRQLNAYLQTQFISDARIYGLGPGRAATLASYGVETAADVEYNRVLGIPGMGPSATNDLCAWRSGLERQFHGNRSQGVPPAERQALLLKYVQVRQQLERKLRGGPARLAEINATLEARLMELARQVEAAYVAMAQAYADVEAMSRRERRRP
jgi:DNA-binding helix-hairpin-helix protein with protein kinase domain